MSSNNTENKDFPIYMETVSAPTNIACIKYWGKASIPLNTPINSSVSITLDQSDLRAVTSAAASLSFESDRLWLNGQEEDIRESRRFKACLEGVRALAQDKYYDGVLVKKEDWKHMHVHVSSYNTFPTAAGLASSAAGYAALVAALAKLFDAKEEFPGQLSTFARQGSGSACRSLYGGFVAWRMGGQKPDASDSLAEQIADEHHWPEIRALILVVSDAKKDTSSTAGMSTSVQTSKLLAHRAAQVVPERMQFIEKAFLEKDFTSFANLTMADSNQFHATCLDTFPPIFYMNDISRSIIKIVHVYNQWTGQVRAAYTFDAGPNAVIYTLDQYSTELAALMLHFYPSSNDNQNYFNNKSKLKEAMEFTLDPSLIEAVTRTGREVHANDVKMMYYTKSGPGPLTLTKDEALIDATTGLNTYHA